MKIENNVLFATAGFLSLFSSVAIAGISSTEHNSKNGNVAPEMSHVLALEKAIQANAEQKLAAETKAEAKKFTQVVALAGGRQDEVEKRKNEVINTYKTWHELKSTVGVSRSANANDFKAVEVAAQAYSQANKAFLELQKDILAKNGVPSGSVDVLIAKNAIPFDVIDAINAAPATAAGLKK